MHSFRAFTLLLLSLSFALPLSADPALFTSEKDNFSIMAPAKLSTTPMKNAKQPGVVYRTKVSQDEYAIRVINYEQKVEVGARAQRGFFDALRMRTLTQLRGALVFERDVTLDDHLGREFTIRSTNIKGLEGIPVRFTQRIFAVDKRLYTLTTVARQHGLRHERFFDSFALNKKVRAPEGLRFETRRVSHANNVAYTSRLPARHRLYAIEKKSAPVEWSEDISELLYSRVYKASDEQLTLIVGTLAIPEGAVTPENVEVLFNQARVKALAPLNLVAPKMSIELGKNGISRRLRASGTQNIGGVKTFVSLGLFLFKDRYYQVLVLSDSAPIAAEGLKFLSTFEPHEMEK